MSLLDIPHRSPVIGRVRALMLFMGAAFAALLGRLWYLQIDQGQDLLKLADENRTRKIRRLAPRGRIEDRNGQVLATNRQEIVISVAPETAHKHPEVIHELELLVHLPAEEIMEIIEHDKVTPIDPVPVVAELDLATATRVEENRARLPGVVISPQPIRAYPDGPLLGHVLGQMGQIPVGELKDRRDEGYRPGDLCGRQGIERAYDRELRGIDGGREVEVDARGRIRRDVANTDPIPGATLRLTIDKELQKIAVAELRDWGKRGHAGAVVAMDPRNGAILALANEPSYDPNLFASGISANDWKSVRDHPMHPLVNRAVSMAVAPGSTFKLISATAGLETGKATVDSDDFCQGYIMLGKTPRHCHKRAGHGHVDFLGAIAQSCDVFFYHLGQRLGPDSIAEYAHRFGLGERTGIDLQRIGDPVVESQGLVPTPDWKEHRKRHPEPWVGGDTVAYAIGQAMLGVTPLQMCNATAAIANGGTLYHPHLVDSIREVDAQGRPVSVRKIAAKPMRKLDVSPGAIRSIVKAMQMVMEPGGTAWRCAIPGVAVAGKTGTAEVRYKGAIANNAWFVGFAPIENPTIVVCVFVEHGGHGGETAAPIARKILAKYFHVAVTDTQPASSLD